MRSTKHNIESQLITSLCRLLRHYSVYSMDNSLPVCRRHYRHGDETTDKCIKERVAPRKNLATLYSTKRSCLVKVPAKMNKILGILVVLAASVAMTSASCSRPSHPWYGYHSGSWTYYPLGHRITYRCWEGYALHGHRSNIKFCVYKDNSYIWRYPTSDCRSKLAVMHATVVI